MSSNGRTGAVVAVVSTALLWGCGKSDAPLTPTASPESPTSAPSTRRTGPEHRYQPISRLTEVWGDLTLSDTQARLAAFEGSMQLDPVGVMPASAGPELGQADIFAIRNADEYFAANRGRNGFCDEPPRWLLVRRGTGSGDDILLGLLTRRTPYSYTPDQQGYCGGGLYRRK